MHSKKKKLLQHLRTEVFCRLGVSPVHGIGVFAIRAIPKGAKPLKSRLKMHEIKFNHAEVSSLPPQVRKELDMFCYYDKHHMLISAIGLNSMNMSVYLNHSKTPNLKMRKDGDLIALRDIQQDEELMMDYDDSFGEVHTFGPGVDD
jgi:SET domain-containing protein